MGTSIFNLKDRIQFQTWDCHLLLTSSNNQMPVRDLIVKTFSECFICNFLMMQLVATRTRCLHFWSLWVLIRASVFFFFTLCWQGWPICHWLWSTTGIFCCFICQLPLPSVAQFFICCSFISLISVSQFTSSENQQVLVVCYCWRYKEVLCLMGW